MAKDIHEVTINIVELASELAHNELLKSVDNESDLYEDPYAGITNYKEFYQGEFDSLYDIYWSIIERTITSK